MKAVFLAMLESFLSVGYLVSLAIDAVVLFFVARHLNVPNSTLQKAVILVVVSAALGYILGPALLITLLASLSFFLLALLATVIIRLILIKMVYKVGFSKAFSIWIFSAIVSILVGIFLPFY